MAINGYFETVNIELVNVEGRTYNFKLTVGAAVASYSVDAAAMEEITGYTYAENGKPYYPGIEFENKLEVMHSAYMSMRCDFARMGNNGGK